MFLEKRKIKRNKKEKRYDKRPDELYLVELEIRGHFLNFKIEGRSDNFDNQWGISIVISYFP